MTSGEAQGGESNKGCIIAALLIGLIALVSQCSGGDRASSLVESTPASTLSPIESATPPPLEPLAKASVGTGFRHLKLVLDAGQDGGAQLYSENCYSGVESSFSWTVLDRCGAFDQAAVRLADQGRDQIGAAELSYFEPETAAGRYLGATRAAGLSGDAADERFEALRSISRAMASVRFPAPATTSQESEPTDEPPAEGATNSSDQLPIEDEGAGEEVLVG